MMVPDTHAELIGKLSELPEAKITEFVNVLRSAGSHFNVEDLSNEVSNRLEIPRALTSGIITVLGSLYLTKDARRAPLEEFVDEVGEALKRSKAFPREAAEARWNSVRRFFLEALALENTLGTAAKAGYVLTQHERIFVNARILTDVRPIFHSEVSETPGAATIIHMLRITERDNHRQQTDTYFALDSNDLRLLKELIDRAQKKEATIRSLMDTAGLKVLEPKPTF